VGTHVPGGTELDEAEPRTRRGAAGRVETQAEAPARARRDPLRDTRGCRGDLSACDPGEVAGTADLPGQESRESRRGRTR
jgi:hypothetical protein